MPAIPLLKANWFPPSVTATGRVAATIKGADTIATVQARHQTQGATARRKAQL
jgi:hypothetical protein